jgi:glycerophosphoryl diester phosphodiesterase
VQALSAQDRRIIVIAHRGEHLRRPENTLPAFLEAIRAGADFIEVDVRTSSDGKLVLSHDATVDRCTNGVGRVDAMTFAQLRELDAGIVKGSEFAGTRIPSFDEALELARGKIGIYVDIKQAAAQELVSHIESHDMTDHVAMYCSPAMCKQLHDLSPRLKLMPESNSADHSRMLVETLHPAVIAFGAGDFKPDIIAVAKESRAAVYVDVMGETDAPAGWQAAIDAGADGLQTDRPEPLVEYLKAKGYR